MARWSTGSSSRRAATSAAQGVGQLEGLAAAADELGQLLQEQRVAAAAVVELVGERAGGLVAQHGLQQLAGGARDPGARAAASGVVSRAGRGGVGSSPPGRVVAISENALEASRASAASSSSSTRRLAQWRSAMTIVTGPLAHSAASTASTARISSWCVRAGSMPSSGDGWPKRCSRPLTSAARCSSSAAGPIRSDRRCSEPGPQLDRDGAGLDVEHGAERTGDRPPPVGLAVGHAGADEDGALLLLHVAVEHLLDQPGLADAALALDDGQDGAPLALGDPHRVDEEGQLELAADERHRHAPAAPARQGERLERQPGRHLLVPAPHLELAHGLVGDGALGGGVRRRTDQHAPRRRSRLQSGSGVHDVTHGRVVAPGPQRARPGPRPC